MAGQSVLNELILEPQYNEGPRDWQNWLTKMNFHYVRVFFMYFTITGVKNIVQQQHFLTMTNPDFSYALHFSVWRKKVKGNGEREQYEYSYICPFLLFPTFRSDVTQRFSCCFHSYLFLLARRPLLSIRKVNGTFMKAFLAGQMYV